MARTAPHEYRSFNDFFTRELRAGVRPLASDANTLVVPADGLLHSAGNHEAGHMTQAKNRTYSITALLNHHPNAKHYQQGGHALVYLAPHNYHRVHMPQEGRLLSCDYVPGAFFPVNQLAARTVPRLFARNERLICYFDCGTYTIAIIFVAAFLVGGMGLVWDSNIRHQKQLHALNRQCREKPSVYTLKKGAELGRFYFGSTVIILTSKPVRAITHATNASCAMGQALAQLS